MLVGWLTRTKTLLCFGLISPFLIWMEIRHNSVVFWIILFYRYMFKGKPTQVLVLGNMFLKKLGSALFVQKCNTNFEFKNEGNVVVWLTRTKTSSMPWPYCSILNNSGLWVILSIELGGNRRDQVMYFMSVRTFIFKCVGWGDDSSNLICTIFKIIFLKGSKILSGFLYIPWE